MKKIYTTVILVLLFVGISNVYGQINELQGTFKGPVELKVWKHWQPSWNVEVVNHLYDFELRRGFDNQGQEVVTLIMNDKKYMGASATILCESVDRVSEWNVKKSNHSLGTVEPPTKHERLEFVWKKSGCLDLNQKRIVTKINVSLSIKNEVVWSYNITPMYVRGKNNSYMKNSIDSYMAHEGSGDFSIELLSDFNKEWDTYAGRKVRPILNFIERNTISSNGKVGTHRHEANQEMWFVEQGNIVVLHGVAGRSSKTYKIDRKWSANGDSKETDEFAANGGWIEERILKSGDFTVIVPNPKNQNEVTFNGLSVDETHEGDVVFWTMGTKN